MPKQEKLNLYNVGIEYDLVVRKKVKVEILAPDFQTANQQAVNRLKSFGIIEVLNHDMVTNEFTVKNENYSPTQILPYKSNIPPITAVQAQIIWTMYKLKSLIVPHEKNTWWKIEKVSKGRTTFEQRTITSMIQKNLLISACENMEEWRAQITLGTLTPKHMALKLNLDNKKVKRLLKIA